MLLIWISVSVYVQRGRAFDAAAIEIEMNLDLLARVGALDLSKSHVVRGDPNSNGPVSSRQLSADLIERTRAREQEEDLIGAIGLAAIGAIFVIGGFKRARHLTRSTAQHT